LKSVAISPSPVEVGVGANYPLTVSVVPESYVYSTVAWKSSDTNVATVTARGTVTGVNEGEAIITATIDGVSGTCKVKVTRTAVPVTGVSLSESSIEIGIGETKTIEAVLKPDNATNKNLSWTSSDTKKLL